MRIGMLGRGIVGSGLAAKLTELGHDVKVGSRDPSLSFADAAAHGDVRRRLATQFRARLPRASLRMAIGAKAGAPGRT